MTTAIVTLLVLFALSLYAFLFLRGTKGQEMKIEKPKTFHTLLGASSVILMLSTVELVVTGIITILGVGMVAQFCACFFTFGFCFVVGYYASKPMRATRTMSEDEVRIGFKRQDSKI